MGPFGFSVGDFITGVNLLIDAVHSLSDTYGAQADYKELGRELQSLNSGLDGIKALSLDSTQTIGISAVNAAVDKCHACVEDFVQRNSKFKSLETTSGKKWSLATVKKCGRGVQWAVWKRDDVAKFRDQVQYHSGAIGMLLATLQVKQSDAHKALTKTISAQVLDFGTQQLQMKRKLSDQQDTVKRICLDTQGIVVKNQASLAQSMSAQHTEVRDCLQSQARDQERAFASQSSATTQIAVNVQSTNAQVEAITALQQSLAGGSTPFQEQMLQILLDGATQSHDITRNQQQMLAKLQDIHTIIRVDKEIPTQVLLSKPVILLDACGRSAPFHLEFIDSAEAFIAVLKVRFGDPIGLRKIEKGQFALEDTRLKHGLSLAKPWTALVRPGQHISMSMVFRRQQTCTGSCPSCGERNDESKDLEVDCGNISCHLTYRRKVESPDQTIGESSSPEEAVPHQRGDVRDGASPSCKICSRYDSVDEEMQHYTRVQILARTIILSDQEQGFQTSPEGHPNIHEGHSSKFRALVADIERNVQQHTFQPFIMGGIERITVIGCVTDEGSAYKDDREIVEQIEEIRAAKKVLVPTQPIESSLARGPTVVEQAKDNGIERHGPRFAAEDQVATEAIRDHLIAFQNEISRNAAKLRQNLPKARIVQRTKVSSVFANSAQKLQDS